jgi:hypothetical protein
MSGEMVSKFIEKTTRFLTPRQKLLEELRHILTWLG